MKKILVIGGSYFAGRVFAMLASRSGDVSLCVVNRGTYKLDLPNVEELVCDRHEPAKLATLLEGRRFDAVVDFCGYFPGEIAPLVQVLGDKARHYLFISTASVYEPAEALRDESAPVVQSAGDIPGAEYALQKALLEQELKDACAGNGMAWSIFRPTFIYGPYNYAPRESFYVQTIAQGQPVPLPTDITARYNFVYVTDVGNALLAAAGDPRAFGQVYNLSAPEELDYRSYTEALQTAYGRPFATVPVTKAQILAENIPVPFPLEGSELYDGSKFADTFGFRYTPFAEGFQKAVNAFKGVYER